MFHARRAYISMRTKLFLFFLIIIGFFYRLYGLDANYSFWTDEEHVAIFSRAILERGKPVLANGYSTGIYQWLQYWASAVSAKIFGLNEFAIRLPSVFFGVLTIWAVYLLAKELFVNSSTSAVRRQRLCRRREESLRLRPAPSGAGLHSGPPSEVFVPLVAAALTTFLNIEILWSRQARPYQALQFFYLLGAWFIYKLTKEEKFNWRYFLGFFAIGILASLMHGLGLVILFSGFIYLLLFSFSLVKKWLPLGILIGLLLSYIFRLSPSMFTTQLGKINNLFYYRVFLWHNYLLLVFLALFGSLSLIFRKRKEWLIIILPLVVQGIFVSFFWRQPFIRYFYVVFPFFILLASLGLVKIVEFGKKLGGWRNIGIWGLLCLLVSFQVFGVRKIVLIPQKTYSLNEDMQEIPEVDWKKIYNFVGEKLKKSPGSILITNWNDLPVWFLGEGKLNYLIRENELDIDVVSGAKYLNSLEKLIFLMNKEPEGYLVVDSWDDAVPEGVREYCHKNLRRELEVDRLYPIQPRYWTVWVYSWGI